MEAEEKGMFDEILASAIEIAEQHGVNIVNTKAAEQLMSVVGSHVTNKRRQEEFFDSMIRPNESCAR